MIEIITSEWCTYCSQAKLLLKDHNLDYVETSLERGLEKLVENKLTTVPQIFIDGKLLPGGYTGLKEYLNADLKATG